MEEWEDPELTSSNGNSKTITITKELLTRRTGRLAKKIYN